MGLASFTACHKIVDEPDEDARIQYYLNHQQFDDAAFLLERRIQENSATDHDRILLASAYAGSAGINTIDCFNVLKPKLFDKSADETSNLNNLRNDEPTLTENDDDHVARVEEELLKFSQQITDFLRISVSIPLVPTEKRFLLGRALERLHDIKAESSEFTIAQLYTAILSVIEFLDYFRDAMPRHSASVGLTETGFPLVYCTVDLSIFFKNMTHATNYLSQAFASLNEARRTSDNPIFENLKIATEGLNRLNALLTDNADLVDVATSLHAAHKNNFCK